MERNFIAKKKRINQIFAGEIGSSMVLPTLSEESRNIIYWLFFFSPQVL